MPGRALTDQPRVALFGKLPAHGDFVRRGDGALVRRLDEWLTGEVGRLAILHGEGLDTLLATLPTWCFVLPGDVAGALIASGDQVGRVFPMVACIDAGAPAERVAEALTRAREAGWRADEVEAALYDVAALRATDGTVGAGWWRPDRGAAAPLGFTVMPEGDEFARLLAEGD